MSTTVSIEDLVDAGYATNDVDRDKAIDAARTVVTAALESASLVEETNSERRKLYIAETAVKILINKANSRSGEGTVAVAFSNFLPAEVKTLMATSSDEDDTSPSIVVDNETFDRGTNHWRK